MNLIETDIPDINTENIDGSKVDLADKIIQNIHPLLDELFIEKKELFKERASEFKTLKTEVLKNKNVIEKLLADYKRKQKIKKLLERTEQLVSLGIVNEGQTKQDTIILLKIVDQLPIDKLNFHLREAMNTISKRF